MQVYHGLGSPAIERRSPRRRITLGGLRAPRADNGRALAKPEETRTQAPTGARSEAASVSEPAEVGGADRAQPSEVAGSRGSAPAGPAKPGGTL
jgi:hypothetical protein